VKLNVDHVIPQSLGGSDAPGNLVTACADCNGGKTSSLPNATPVEDVTQETFRRALEIREASDQKRLTIFTHLHAVWTWSWNKTGHPIGELDELYFAEETHKVLDCGWSERVELTEAAICAGAQNSVDLASYIGHVLQAAPTPLTDADRRFLTCVDTIRAWESAWDMASGGGTPGLDVVVLFNEEVAAAFDTGTHPQLLTRAAETAGQSMSTDLGKHLSEQTPAGGGI
jgi:hypothetical protein